ncbi:MAG: hypothetical protein PHQ81_02405 [Methanofollis sp.]|nr:hypothetical protein [Methanofollis sp.]
MTSLNQEISLDPPICLPAYRRSAKKTSLVVWCPHCGVFHLHGEGPGRLFFHRVAHCVHPTGTEGASPYLASGYFVIPIGKTLPEEVHPVEGLLQETPPAETPRTALGTWARPLTYAEAVDHIVEWYLQAEYPEVEIARALEGFAWMYERTAGRYQTQGSEQPAI